MIEESWFISSRECSWATIANLDELSLEVYVSCDTETGIGRYPRKRLLVSLPPNAMLPNDWATTIELAGEILLAHDTNPSAHMRIATAHLLKLYAPEGTVEAVQSAFGKPW